MTRSFAPMMRAFLVVAFSLLGLVSLFAFLSGKILRVYIYQLLCEYIFELCVD